MAGTASYNNDKVVTGEVEYPVNDPASGAFFQADYKKNDDLKAMLDGSKDSLKLEAMKRIIGMIAKGRDASDLFPAVVKNVVSKNIEVKKLVYVYLVRHAEQQQDLALLSISTFQRALKDPNQLIRASALRVLSSIRVGMIVPIVMLAIRDSAADMSPYVRKTAAHAIPKLYSLDPERQEELVLIIDKLLSDKAPLVVGSAAMAFSEVCADRMSLIHKSYKKLCLLLADVDEWGQLALLNVLTAYAKMYFADPNTNEAQGSESEGDKPFYESESSEKGCESKVSLEPDHRLLLRVARLLLQSRNAGVVMAVAQLFYHCAPAQDLPPVAKALVRLLRAPVEVQSVVLNAIASLTVNKRSLFEPFLKSFFIRTSDATHIKLLKLEILTNLSTEASAPVVLREFQTYVTSSDKLFVAATIQAIGRLALAIPSETETCLNGLLHLLSSKDETVVCEAVVVVKRVVGGGAASARAAVLRAAKLLRTDRLAAGARAAAVWLVSEHGVNQPRAAAILAHLAQNFTEQDELVKLQLLTLAVKLSITQPDTKPLGQYIIQLSRYDTSYDVRDRARFLSRFLTPSARKSRAAQIFLGHKPAANNDSRFKDREQFTVGTLSHYIGAAAAGAAGPAGRVSAEQRVAAARDRNPPVSQYDEYTPHAVEVKSKEFYSEPDTGSCSSSTAETSSQHSSSDEDDSDDEDKAEPKKIINNMKSSNSSSSSSESSSDSSESSGESSESEHGAQSKHGDQPQSKPPAVASSNDKSNLDLLLELEEISALPAMTPTCGGLLSPPSIASEEITPVGPSLVPSSPLNLLSRVTCSGLSGTARWTRAPHLYSSEMIALSLTFTNDSGQVINNIAIEKKSGSGSLHAPPPLPPLPPSNTTTTSLGLHYNDSIQPIHFTITCSLGEFPTSITPPVGELMRAVLMSEQRWETEQKKLRGMNECEKKTAKWSDDQAVCLKVYETANVAAITSSGNYLRFAGRLMSSQDLVLLSVKMGEDFSVVKTNCANMAIASMLANQVAQALAR